MVDANIIICCSTTVCIKSCFTFIILCRVAVLLVVEYSWNTYPSTVVSSLLLHLAHLIIMAALFVKETKVTSVQTIEATKRE